MSASRFASEFSTSGDYRFRSEIRTIPADVVYGSFKLNASASDNWGEPLEIWFTVLNETTGQYLYDSGWTLSPIVNEAVQVTNNVTTLRTYFRIRYPEGKGTNPITNSYFSGAEWSITYDRLVQIEQQTEIPEYWYGTTTVTISLPNPVFTTSTYIDWDSQVSGNDGVFQSIKYLISTTFGITDTWQSLVYVMNYMNGKLPYVYAISFFCGVTGIAVWFLEK